MPLGLNIRHWAPINQEWERNKKCEKAEELLLYFSPSYKIEKKEEKMEQNRIKRMKQNRIGAENDKEIRVIKGNLKWKKKKRREEKRQTGEKQNRLKQNRKSQRKEGGR